MPVALERALKRKASKLGLGKERKNAYVYGTLRKTGWKPSREKKMSTLNTKLIRLSQIDDALDSIIRFDYDDDDKKSLLGSAATSAGLVGAGVGGTLAHQAIQRTGGYGALLDRIKGGAGQAAGQVGQAAGKVGQTAGQAVQAAGQAGQAVGQAAGQAGKTIGTQLSGAKLGYGLERSGIGAATSAGSGLAYKAGALAGKGVNAVGSAWQNILAKLGGTAAKALESKEEPIEFGAMGELLSKLRGGAKAADPLAEYEAGRAANLAKIKAAGAAAKPGPPRPDLVSPHKPEPTYHEPARLIHSNDPLNNSLAGYSSRSKPIQFDASILGAWSGASGHTSKIDQLEFPAGLSPAAALKFPLPKLMRYMNRRNMLQQTFSWKQKRLIELNSKLSEING